MTEKKVGVSVDHYLHGMEDRPCAQHRRRIAKPLQTTYHGLESCLGSYLFTRLRRTKKEWKEANSQLDVSCVLNKFENMLQVLVGKQGEARPHSST